MNTFRVQNVYQLSKQDECGVKGVVNEKRKSSYLNFEMTANTIIDRTTLRTSYANESATKMYNYLR